LREQVEGMRALFDASLVGQASVKRVLYEKAAQFLNSWGTRTKDPVALHLLSPPGNGKSDFLTLLSELGFQTIYADCQRYADGVSTLAADLNVLAGPEGTTWPTVLILDEPDKLAAAKTTQGREYSPVFFGQFNQILNDGKLTVGGGYGQELNLSDVMVVTASNLAPSDVERFSMQRAKSKRSKTFWEFDVADMQEFHRWLRSSAGTYSALSRIYPDSTVTRMAPNTVVLDALTDQNYRDIATLRLKSTLSRLAGPLIQEGGYDPWLQVTYTPQFEKFLFQNTKYPPSGARHTHAKVDLWVEQLVRIAAIGSPPGDSSVSQPREAVLDFIGGSAVVTVTPVIGHRAARQDPWSIHVEFDKNVQIFVTPKELLAKHRPSIPEPQRQFRITSKMVAAARGLTGRTTSNSALEQAAGEEVFGQSEMISLLVSEIQEYRAATGVPNRPKARVLMGFTGIGKTVSAELVAEKAGLPVVKINLQSYVSDTPETVDKFLLELGRRIRVARAAGKFVLLFEELDKVYEINPVTGHHQQRPIMAVIKDLLDSGVHASSSSGGLLFDIDVRGAFCVYTMNFGPDIFGFKADPRLTSLDDMEGAIQNLRRSKVALRQVLGELYLPDTVNRFLDKTYLVPGLKAEDHARIIQRALGLVAKERFAGEVENQARIELKASAPYLKYLFQETVVPSEGGRHTSGSARRKIFHDVELGLQKIGSVKGFKFAPLVMELHYRPASQKVVVRARRSEVAGDPFVVLAEETVALFFARPYLYGRIPEARLLVSTHEFGHAYTRVLFGGRFRSLTAVDPNGTNFGGYVRLMNNEGPEAEGMVANLSAKLGSRAMERLINGGSVPEDSDSVLSVCRGCAGDIEDATAELYAMLHELAMDPKGGSGSRRGRGQPLSGAAHADAVYGSLTNEEGVRLGAILRRIEEDLIRKLLESHPREWYVDKIKVFARHGEMSEREFYDLIELGSFYPGPGSRLLGLPVYAGGSFGDVAEKLSPEEERLRNHPWGLNQRTMVQNLAQAMEDFKLVIKEIPPPLSRNEPDCTDRLLSE
jgi:hypothetical protein